MLFIVVISLDSMAEMVAETAIMKLFDHPNILKLLGVCVDSSDDDMLKAILPYMANGDLKSFLKRSRVGPANTSEFANVCIVCFVRTYICTYIHMRIMQVCSYHTP